MDSQRFDALTRRLGGAGSRRQMLAAFLAGALAHLVRGEDIADVAAACKGFNAKCKGNAGCCADAGLRCVKVGKVGKGGKGGKGGKRKKRRKRRCRCKNGTCPPGAPCCVRGKCEELCPDECCADCFVEVDGTGPVPDSDFCCPANKVCGPNKKKLSDDRCCLPSEECVGGECCNNAPDSPLGSVVCGGKCCAEHACCNGQCCGDGKVCANTPQGLTCVSDSRGCIDSGNCFSGEICHGGVCCAGQRVCTAGGIGNHVCCAADEYCELQGDPLAVCCKINTTCNSFKGHRVRR